MLLQKGQSAQKKITNKSLFLPCVCMNISRNMDSHVKVYAEEAEVQNQVVLALPPIHGTKWD